MPPIPEPGPPGDDTEDKGESEPVLPLSVGAGMGPSSVDSRWRFTPERPVGEGAPFVDTPLSSKKSMGMDRGEACRGVSGVDDDERPSAKLPRENEMCWIDGCLDRLGWDVLWWCPWWPWWWFWW